MKIRTAVATVALFIGLAGCVEQPEPTVPEQAEPALPDQSEAVDASERLTMEIDSRFGRVQQELQVLQSALDRLENEDQRERVARTLTRIRARMEDLAWLRLDIEEAESREKLGEIRLNMWEAYRDVAERLIRARLRAATSRDELETVIETERAALEGDLHELQERSKEADPDLRAGYENVIDSVRRRGELLEQADVQSETRWEEVREDLLDRWREL